MAKQNRTRKEIAISLIFLALIGIFLIWVSSFRLGLGSMDLVWQVNFERVALAFAVGVAFAGSGALIGSAHSHMKIHVLGFAVVSAASTTLLIGTLWKWPLALTALTTVIIIVVTWLFVNRVLQYKQSTNLWTAVILGFSFALSVFNFLLASSVGGLSGNLVYWLQGSLLEISDYGFLALLLCMLSFIWMLAAKTKQVPASLLLGLGVGIAGPVFFVAYLVPKFVCGLIGVGQGKLFLITCGAVGAFLMVFVDAIPRLLVGGYSTTLVIPLSLISIPVFLYYQRAMLLIDFPSHTRAIVEMGLVLFWLLGSVFVVYHATQFAALAA